MLQECGVCAHVARVWSVCTYCKCVECVHVLQVCGVCAHVLRLLHVSVHALAMCRHSFLSDGVCNVATTVDCSLARVTVPNAHSASKSQSQ